MGEAATHRPSKISAAVCRVVRKVHPKREKAISYIPSDLIRYQRFPVTPVACLSEATEPTVGYRVISNVGCLNSPNTTMKNIHPLLVLLCLATAPLTIAPGCSSTATRASTGEFIDDSVVTTRVKTDLARDAATPGSAISVETFKGSVILSGFVDTAEQKRQAGLVATQVAGVREVMNHIQMKTSKST